MRKRHPFSPSLALPEPLQNPSTSSSTPCTPETCPRAPPPRGSPLNRGFRARLTCAMSRAPRFPFLVLLLFASACSGEGDFPRFSHENSPIRPQLRRSIVPPPFSAYRPGAGAQQSPLYLDNPNSPNEYYRNGQNNVPPPQQNPYRPPNPAPRYSYAQTANSPYYQAPGQRPDFYPDQRTYPSTPPIQDDRQAPGVAYYSPSRNSAKKPPVLLISNYAADNPNGASVIQEYQPTVSAPIPPRESFRQPPQYGSFEPQSYQRPPPAAEQPYRNPAPPPYQNPETRAPSTFRNGAELTDYVSESPTARPAPTKSTSRSPPGRPEPIYSPSFLPPEESQQATTAPPVYSPPPQGQQLNNQVPPQEYGNGRPPYKPAQPNNVYNPVQFVPHKEYLELGYRQPPANYYESGYSSPTPQNPYTLPPGQPRYPSEVNRESVPYPSRQTSEGPKPPTPRIVSEAPGPPPRPASTRETVPYPSKQTFATPPPPSVKTPANPPVPGYPSPAESPRYPPAEAPPPQQNPAPYTQPQGQPRYPPEKTPGYPPPAESPRYPPAESPRYPPGETPGYAPAATPPPQQNPNPTPYSQPPGQPRYPPEVTRESVPYPSKQTFATPPAPSVETPRYPPVETPGYPPEKNPGYAPGETPGYPPGATPPPLLNPTPYTQPPGQPRYPPEVTRETVPPPPSVETPRYPPEKTPGYPPAQTPGYAPGETPPPALNPTPYTQPPGQPRYPPAETPKYPPVETPPGETPPYPYEGTPGVPGTPPFITISPLPTSRPSPASEAPSPPPEISVTSSPVSPTPPEVPERPGSTPFQPPETPGPSPPPEVPERPSPGIPGTPLVPERTVPPTRGPFETPSPPPREESTPFRPSGPTQFVPQTPSAPPQTYPPRVPSFPSWPPPERPTPQIPGSTPPPPGRTFPPSFETPPPRVPETPAIPMNPPETRPPPVVVQTSSPPPRIPPVTETRPPPTPFVPPQYTSAPPPTNRTMVPNRVRGKAHVICEEEGIQFRVTTLFPFTGQIFAHDRKRVPSCVHTFTEATLVNITFPYQECGIRNSGNETPQTQYHMQIIVVFEQPDGSSTIQSFISQCLHQKIQYQKQQIPKRIEEALEELHLIPTKLEQKAPIPECRMRIVKEMEHGHDGDGEEVIDSVDLGQPLRIEWSLVPESDAYGFHVRNCTVKDLVSGIEHSVIDERGCSTDINIFAHPHYDTYHDVARVHWHAFKVPDNSQLSIKCNFQICSDIADSNNGLTSCDSIPSPPFCPDLITSPSNSILFDINGNLVEKRSVLRENPGDLHQQVHASICFGEPNDDYCDSQQFEIQREKHLRTVVAAERYCVSRIWLTILSGTSLWTTLISIGVNFYCRFVRRRRSSSSSNPVAAHMGMN